MKNIFLLIAATFFTTLAFSQKNFSETSYGQKVVFRDFEALQKGEAVQLSWTVLNESNFINHQVQKSANGSSFNNIGTLVAQNNSTPYNYTFLDATPTEGNNYYRLSSLDKDGNIYYSNILQVNNGVGRTDFRILSNPVHAGIMNLQFSNIAGGQYFISLYSNNGQKVFARSLSISAGSLTETINLPQSLGHGLYFLQLTNGEMRINKQVILQ